MGKELPVEVRTWVEEAKQALLDEGVTVILQDSEYLEYRPGEFCSGYFVDDYKGKTIFACAMKREWETWFLTFVHEFCHFEQWRDHREWWNKHKIGSREGLDLALEHWQGEREATSTQVIMWCMLSAETELDCERMVVEKIATHGFPIDTAEYAKKANSYITYYYAMPELRGWCNGDSPQDIPEILAMMPDHLELSPHEYWDLAARAMDLYREHCLHAKPEDQSG